MFHANGFLDATSNIKRREIIKFERLPLNHSSSHLLHYLFFHNSYSSNFIIWPESSIWLVSLRLLQMEIEAKRFFCGDLEDKVQEEGDRGLVQCCSQKHDHHHCHHHPFKKPTFSNIYT